MRNLNHVQINGRLGKAPELKETANGVKVTDFSIANNRDYKNKNGEEVKRVNWVNCRAYKGLAETICNYLNKGSRVAINGELCTDEWEDKETKEKRWRTYILVTELEFLDSRSSNEGNQSNQNTQNSNTDTSNQYEPYNYSIDDDEDVF